MTWKLPTALGGWHPPSLAEGLLEEEVSPEPVAFPEENDERDVASLAHGKAWGKAVFSRYGAVTGGEAMQLELATDFGEGFVCLGSCRSGRSGICRSVCCRCDSGGGVFRSPIQA